MDVTPTIIGRNLDPFREGSPVAIVPDARRKHLGISGATGAGKSHLIRQMCRADIAAGHGITVIDPHGDLVEDLAANAIPKWRTEDVIYLDATDRERAMAINILDTPPWADKALTVSNALSVFEYVWKNSWGQRLEHCLRNALLALMEQPFPVSLIALPRLLTDDAFRQHALTYVHDPVVFEYFKKEYDRWPHAFRQEAISPVLNRVGAFLTNPLLRTILGKAPSSFDFRAAMDRRKIILCKLSKGAIGTDNARLLGSLIVMQEKLAALSRGDIAETDRVPHFLYIDEAHNFIADFESILAETRKYWLGLITVLQGYSQLSDDAASAVFNNAASLITFRVSNEDAERLSSEFAGAIPAASLQELEDYTAYVKTLVCDETRCWPHGPEKIETYPPAPRGRGIASKESVIRLSNRRYTRPRREVDAEIARFLRRQFKAKEQQSAGSAFGKKTTR